MSINLSHVQVNVSRNCLLEFLDILDQSGCHNICVTYSDYGWHVHYDSPFTRDPEVKGCDAPDAGRMPEFNKLNPASLLNCSNCVKLNDCVDKYTRHMFVYCNERDKVTRSGING